MNRPIRIYIALLTALLLPWLVLQGLMPDSLLRQGSLAQLPPVLLLYGAAHLCRLARLAMLTLDQRARVPALLAAHGLTAFPSSFLPYKIGEILRLAAFLSVFDDRHKALAVWLAERCADVLVLAALMLALSLFQVQLPAATRTVFLIFLLVSAFGLLGLFTVAKTFVYLNRHLVLNSSTPRGLRLLRASHALRQLELALLRSLEGRLIGLLLLSSLIWLLEISALALFIQHLLPTDSSFAALFANGLLNNLSASPPAASQYQSLVLAALALLSLAALALAQPRYQGKS